MKNILLIEDDPLIAGAMGRFLEGAGFAVRSAPDGPGGLRLAAKERPDIVLLDLLLPGLDGFEVCRRLKASEGGRGMPVLVVTSLARMAEVERAYACGADDYIIKPFENERLLEKIEKLLAPAS